MNIVILAGRVGRDPEVKSFANGDRVARISLATRRWKRTTQGDIIEHTDWHIVNFYGPAQGGLVDRVLQIVRKGALISVRGELVYQASVLPDGTKIQRPFVAVRSQGGLELHVAARPDNEATQQKNKTHQSTDHNGTDHGGEVNTGIDGFDDSDPLGLVCTDEDDI